MLDTKDILSSIAEYLDRTYVHDFGLVEKYHDSVILWTESQKFVVKAEELDIPEDYYQEDGAQ